MKEKLSKFFDFIKKYKKIIASIVLLIIAGGLYFKFMYSAKPNIENKKSLNVAIVSDIHAGSGKNGHNENAIVHPSEYKNNLRPTMDSDPDLIITLGDNLNDGDEKCHPYVDNLKSYLSKFNVLYGKGNHDRDCFRNLSDQDYYYHDYNKASWRIIILDHDIDIDPNELSWLKEALKTDKKVLIATHVPFFSPSRDENTLLPQYAEVEKVISEAGNVKYVFMGHLHSRLWDKVYNDIHYYIIPSVSGDEYPQYFTKLTLE